MMCPCFCQAGDWHTASGQSARVSILRGKNFVCSHGRPDTRKETHANKQDRYLDLLMDEDMGRVGGEEGLEESASPREFLAVPLEICYMIVSLALIIFTQQSPRPWQRRCGRR